LDTYNLKTYFSWIEDDTIVRIQQAYLAQQLQLQPDEVVEKAVVETASTLISRTRFHLGVASALVLAMRVLNNTKSPYAADLRIEMDKALERMQNYFGVIKPMRAMLANTPAKRNSVLLQSPISLPPDLSEINLDLNTPTTNTIENTTDSNSSPSGILYKILEIIGVILDVYLT
jgi:hypothetical protein